MSLPKSRQLGALGIGLVTTESFNHIVDFVLFPIVIGAFGVWIGWPILLVICLLVNYINIAIYRRTGFGDVMNWLEQIRRGEHLSVWRRFLRLLLNAGHIPLILALILEDPAKGFVYARSRVLSQRFNAADIALFIGANILGSAVWVWGWVGVIGVFRRII